LNDVEKRLCSVTIQSQDSCPIGLRVHDDHEGLRDSFLVFAERVAQLDITINPQLGGKLRKLVNVGREQE
jgi:hypothetical protein